VSAPSLTDALEHLVAASREAIAAARAGDADALHSALDRREVAVAAAIRHGAGASDRGRAELAFEAARLGDELAAATTAARDEIARELERAKQAGAVVAAYAEGSRPASASLDLRR
jgi:hypothetical protein